MQKVESVWPPCSVFFDRVKSGLTQSNFSLIFVGSLDIFFFTLVVFSDVVAVWLVIRHFFNWCMRSEAENSNS